MFFRRYRVVAVLSAAALFPGLTILAQAPAPAQAPAAAQEKQATPAKTASVVDRIKDEGLKQSQVMKTLSYLTDVIGPRLTLSPNMKRANLWTRDKLAEWGLKDAHLEAWGPFGRGWSLKNFTAQVVEPQCIPLIAYPKAWSPSTNGVITGPVVYYNPRNEEDLAKYKGKLKNALVLTVPVRELRAHFEPLGKRMTDSELLRLADAMPPGQPNRAFMMNLSNPPRRARNVQPNQAMSFFQKRAQFLIDEGVGAVADMGYSGDGGTIFVMSANAAMGGFPMGMMGAGGRRQRPWDKEPPAMLPQMSIAVEHYNRMMRMLEQGVELKAQFVIDAQYHDDDLMGYNTVAEIPGTDLKDELVMLGGHMDSWHTGTGATDNGAGISVCMEAVRILQALNLKPRRTIRIALWSGEEQGLLGSVNYVREHFGGWTNDSKADAVAMFDAVFKGKPLPAPTRKFETKPEFDKLSAYYNLDNGTGKIRGVYLEGNDGVRPYFRRWLAPFAEMGATTLTPSPTGGTDHESFDDIGLPGFQFIQDQVEYDTRTHHSNMDVYDRCQADDLKQASVIMASFLYNTAMLDEKLPRKPRPDQMRSPGQAR